MAHARGLFGTCQVSARLVEEVGDDGLIERHHVRHVDDGVGVRKRLGQSFARVGINPVAGACDDGFVAGVL
ncbi:hypothetical protein D3C72_2284240 [compost metagenome]